MKQLVEMIEAVAYEKGMPEDAVREAMEGAIAALARRESKEPGSLFHAEIDENGEVSVWRVWEIVDNVMDEDRERLGDNVGDVEMDIAPVPQWTRQGLQVVKQVLAQRLRQGLRQTIVEQWKGRVGEVVLGVVKRVDKNKILIDLGEPAEGVLSHKDRIPGEMLKVGHRVRAVVEQVNEEGPAPAIELSRSSENFLRELIAIEVPEVEMGQVKIKALAREPGSRAKVAVEAGPGLRNHPAAVCVGMRGIRAQAISGELNGEKIEFIEWNPNDAQFLISALEPAEITTMVIDENTQEATVSIAKDKMARAIGGRGQNVRLASKLTGWNIKLLSNEEFQEQQALEIETAKSELMELMDLDEEFAAILVEEGYFSVDEIAQASVGDLMYIEGIDMETAEVLKERASDAVMLREALSNKNSNLFDLEGMTEEFASALADQDVQSLQDIADLGIGDIEWSDEEQLGQWILKAREMVGMI